MSLLHIAGGATEDKLYPEDVFVSYLRTGTGADVVVTTGIDYTKGFMTWTKGRSGATDHAIYDSARGVTKDLVSNSTAAETTQATGLKSVSTTGHTIGSLAKMNTSGATYVDWVFRKAPKFFDVVTYTGTNTNPNYVSHSLGIQPGMIIVKAVGTTSNWFVWHRNTGASTNAYSGLSINTTSAAMSNKLAQMTSTNFNAAGISDSSSNFANANGVTYVAYLFAHDPSVDGTIQCGSYVGNGSSNGPEINLGWEPQYVLAKNVSSESDWQLVDSMRGMVVGSGDAQLLANSSNKESNPNDAISPLSTGFKVTKSGTSFNASGQTCIYLAIRRPMKVPTSGTEVYNAIARTGTGAVATVTGVGFAPDMLVVGSRNAANGTAWWSRMQGVGYHLRSYNTDPETNSASTVTALGNNSSDFGADESYAICNYSGRTYINHFFKRAKGFFDVVCYTGTGVARTVNHNLGVVPELMIVKSRSVDNAWYVWFNFTSTTYRQMYLNLTYADGGDVAYSTVVPSMPTSSVFSLGTNSATNASSSTYVAYLFATLAGISKVGSYTGNGSSQTINCGFTTGARFVLCKRTDSTGDWYIWDTARGIVAANDPHLSLNTTVAEVTTDDSVDPEASGFIVNQNTATNINVNGASYIFLSIA